MRKHVLVVVMVLSMVPAVAGLGVSPPYLDLGEVRPGETRTVEMYVTTQRSEPFEVVPSIDDPLNSMVFDGEYFPADAYSEEDISEWVRFTQDTYRVDPFNETTVVVGGDTIASNGAVEFRIRVPEDAEPGYHAATLSISPQITSGGGTSTAVVAQSVPMFFFYVERSNSAPQRRVSIQDVRAFRTGPEEVRVDAVLRNTGTVTTTVREGELDMRVGSGDARKRLDIGPVTVAPGGFETVTKYWYGENIEAGAYSVDGEASWLTGQMTSRASFSIPDRIEIVPSDQGPGQQQVSGEDEQDPLPLWLVAMTLVVLAVLMYSFEIAPIWIFATVGLVGISGFIALSSVTNALLAVPLIIFLATVYLV